MKLYRFTAPGKVAITNDKTGGNLPSGMGWRADGETTIDAVDGPRVGAGSAAIMRAIEQVGLFVWPVKPS